MTAEIMFHSTFYEIEEVVVFVVWGWVSLALMTRDSVNQLL